MVNFIAGYPEADPELTDRWGELMSALTVMRASFVLATPTDDTLFPGRIMLYTYRSDECGYTGD